jgi:hypothetical protein
LQSSIDQIYSLQARSRGQQPQTQAPEISRASIADVMPWSIFQYVLNSRDRVLLSSSDLNDASMNVFARDVFFRQPKAPVSTSSNGNGAASHPSHAQSGVAVPKSVLCLPMVKGGVLIGMVYLENQHQDMAVSFGKQHLQVLQLLLSQAALSIENARFTQQLQDRNLQLLAEVAQRQRAEQDMRRAKDIAEASAQSKSAFLSNMSVQIMRSSLSTRRLRCLFAVLIDLFVDHACTLVSCS